MTYTYECAAGVEFDVEQSINDPRLATCPVCGKCTPKRLISAARPFALMDGPSGGWGSTGYAKRPHERQAEAILGRPLVKAAR